VNDHSPNTDAERTMPTASPSDPVQQLLAALHRARSITDLQRLCEPLVERLLEQAERISDLEHEVQEARAGCEQARREVENAEVTTAQRLSEAKRMHEEQLTAVNQRATDLERQTLEYAQIALELREHANRSERLSTRLQRLVA
jgi:predicted nuclease with TOPRIM domain